MISIIYQLQYWLHSTSFEVMNGELSLLKNALKMWERITQMEIWWKVSKIYAFRKFLQDLSSEIEISLKLIIPLSKFFFFYFHGRRGI